MSEQRNYMAEVQALIDQKWKENPDEMKRVMAEIKAKEKKKAKVKTPKVVSFDPELTKELIAEMDKDWDDVDVSKIKDLIEKGADVEAKDKWGMTPLNLACRNKSLELAKLLLDKGADVMAKVGFGDRWTPLHRASDGNAIKIVKLLIERGADPMAKCDRGNTPLDLAQSDEMQELLKKYMK